MVDPGAAGIELDSDADEPLPLALDRVISGGEPMAEVMAGLSSEQQLELRGLLALAGQVTQAAAQVTPDPAFRAAARERLMERMAAPAVLPVDDLAATRPLPVVRLRPRRARWLVSLGVAAVMSLSLGTVAVMASDNSLPGEPLYAVKEARESAEVQFAPDPAARTAVLLRLADTRLDETLRLAEQGDAAATAQAADRYAQAVAQVADATSDAPQADVQSELDRQAATLAQVIDQAPPQARLALERALAATDQTTVSDTAPNEVAAPAATVAPTFMPTVPTAVPTVPPTSVPPTAMPTASRSAVAATPTTEPREDDSHPGNGRSETPGHSEKPVPPGHQADGSDLQDGQGSEQKHEQLSAPVVVPSGPPAKPPGQVKKNDGAGSTVRQVAPTQVPAAATRPSLPQPTPTAVPHSESPGRGNGASGESNPPGRGNGASDGSGQPGRRGGSPSGHG